MGVAALAAAGIITAGTGVLAQSPGSGQVEIFTYWTAGGEADGLAAIQEVFAQQHPGIEVINAVVAGGAGSNANAVLATRMTGGNPPDTFQIHGGAELIDTWVTTGFTQSLADFYVERDLGDKFPQGIIDLVSYEGAPYSVPVGVHRNGVLWNNAAVLAEHGIEAPADWDAFFAAADTLKAAGVTPLALGDIDKWEDVNLFEQILLSHLGAEDYRGIWAGTVPWTDSRVTDALTTFGRVLDYVNDDHATLTWDQAAGKVLDGSAAFNVMGDWAKGYFTANGWAPGSDFGWSPVPGTEGTFTVVTDSFAIPLDIQNQDNAIAWLDTLASVEGQDAFNPKKGSIPARVDADTSLYDAYSQAAMVDFGNLELVPSQANGPATIPAFLTPFTDAVNVFVTSRDVAATQTAIAEACVSTGACPAP
ncbi:MAG: carbohydrate ABC transporter substrate-binding protein [Chloroflexi bacterium]|nr:carbohydrate ABC transporter substrate-binding protein [Chloroflexota bacterium]